MQTLGSSQSQLTLDQFDTLQGLMPMTGSCGIVFGCHATKERSPLSWVFFRPVFGLAVCWLNKSLYTLLLINRIAADGCVITLLL